MSQFQQRMNVFHQKTHSINQNQLTKNQQYRKQSSLLSQRSNHQELEEQNQKPMKRFAKEKYILQKISHTQVTPFQQSFQPYDLSRSPAKKKIMKVKPELGQDQIENSLINENIIVNEILQSYKYLPIEIFDDSSFDYLDNEQIASRIHEDNGIKAQVLIQLDGSYRFVDAVITDYSFSRGLFEYKFAEQVGEVPRLFFICHFENPQRFVDKWKVAIKNRIYMDSLLRYNYYIDNMKTDDVQQLEERQIIQIRELLSSYQEHEKINNILEEVNKAFIRCQNKILFDHFLIKEEHFIFSQSLILPPIIKPPVPLKGKMTLETQKGAKFKIINDEGVVENFEPRTFNELKRDFQRMSLTSIRDVQRALSKIRNINLEVLQLDLFYFHYSQPIRLDDLKSLQDHLMNRSINYIRNQWITQIVEIIKTELHFTNKKSSILDGERVDRFFQLVRVMMQDTLLTLIQRNLLRVIISFQIFYQLYFSFYQFSLREVIISGTNQVKNIPLWADNQQININECLGFLTVPIKIYETFPPEIFHWTYNSRPMFIDDVTVTPNDDDYCYSYPPQNLMQLILNDFDRILRELSQIPDPEPRILENYFKFQNSTNLRTPQRPFQMPMPSKYPAENLWLWELFEALRKMLDQIVHPAQKYLTEFVSLRGLLRANVELFVKECQTENGGEVDFENFAVILKKQIQMERQVENVLPISIVVSIFDIKLQTLTQQLCRKQRKLVQGMMEYMSNRCREMTNSILHDFSGLQMQMREIPENIEDLTKLRTWLLQSVPIWLQQKQHEIDKCMKVYELLEHFQYHIRSEDIQKKWTVFGLPQQIRENSRLVQAQLEISKVALYQDMVMEQTAFKHKIDQIEREVNLFNQYQKIDDYKNVSKRVNQLTDILKQFQQDAAKFNQRQILFEKEQTDYNIIQNITKSFQPYIHLWTTADKWYSNYQSWLIKPWNNVNAESIANFVEEAYVNLNSAAKSLKERDINSVLRVTEKLKISVEEFRPKIPLLVGLKKKGMRDRHWEKISDEVGFTVYPTNSFCFQTVLDLGLMQWIDICVEVGEQAEKEYKIEQDLSNMHNVWAGTNFIIEKFRNFSILKNIDDLQSILDEHLLITQTMQFSLFKKPFEDQIIEWYLTLKMLSKILEETQKLQNGWIRFQPIFECQDVIKQLPLEARRFRMVDKLWGQVMNSINQNTLVIKFAQNNSETLLGQLKDGNSKIESNMKELESYLARKREIFPRFYFICSSDLIDILSKGKEPESLQFQLGIVFEGIKALRFDQQNKIIALQSHSEQLLLQPRIITNEKQVEQWGCELEEGMQDAVRREIDLAVKKYSQFDRKKWMIEQSGQMCITASIMIFTSEVEEAIFNGGSHKLREYWELQETNIQTLVDIIRQRSSDSLIIKLNSLLVQDIYAKEIVEQLWKSAIENISAFEWLQQIRYYNSPNGCIIKVLQTIFPYGNEYLGTIKRLVITPQTYRCQLTLLNLIQLNLGGISCGPSGSGKTEIIKDLAKSTGKQCIVFNCSKELDYVILAQFFKGLGGTGIWCCLDDFNRITLEVLSVVAQQIQVLLRAKDQQVFELDGTNIKIKTTFGIFTTMNSTQKQVFPNNLKAQFKIFMLLTPDFQFIVEVLLMAAGFRKFKQLAYEITTFFENCQTQLSNQDHYNFGIGTMRSIISVSQMMEKDNNSIYKSIRLVFLPKLTKDDIPIFDELMKQIFKYEYVDIISDLQIAIKNQADKLGYQPINTDKAVIINETLQFQHGVIVIGLAGSGKSICLKLLAQGLQETIQQVNIFQINPKSLNIGQLYGCFNNNREWTEGVFPYLLKQPAQSTQWFIFDGPIDSLWIESMNTLLDDSKQLCLLNGQIIQLQENTSLIFETDNLSHISPQTISRCGIVFVEFSHIIVKATLKSLLHKLPNNIKKRNTVFFQLEILLDRYIPTLLEQIKKIQPEVNEINLCNSLFKVLQTLLFDYIETDTNKPNPEQMKQLDDALDSIFFYSVVCSLGIILDLEGRKMFETHLRELAKMHGSAAQLPDPYSFFDTTLSIQENKFIPINYSNGQIPQLYYHEIIVPNQDLSTVVSLNQSLIGLGYPVLLTGPSATYKTTSANIILQNLSLVLKLNFTTKSTSTEFQSQMESHLEKRRSGYLGPQIGEKYMIFIDNLNLPMKDEFGSQPPVELLRQYFDYNGWYKENKFMKIEDTYFLAAKTQNSMRQVISSRTLRHFNIIQCPQLETQSIMRIFSTLCLSQMKAFSESVRQMMPVIVASVSAIHEKLKERLQPTPNKPHYCFTMRDVWKVFQGICSASCKQIVNDNDLIYLWRHEIQRVYYDRLVSSDDREIFDFYLQMEGKNFNFNEEIITKEPIKIFCDFVGKEKTYQAYDIQFLKNQVQTYLHLYNENQKSKLDLVIFNQACEYIVYITRILKLPFGNLILYGPTGNGKKSLVRLANFIREYICVEQVNEEILQKVMLDCGLKQLNYTLLLTEYTNNLIELPDQFTPPDTSEIVNFFTRECSARQIQPTIRNCIEQFRLKIKQNLHIILCVEENFQTLMNQYPSLNTAYIIYMSPWPQEALTSVSQHILLELEELHIQQRQVIQIFRFIQESAENLVRKFNEQGGCMYITPQSFLNLINNFKYIYIKKRDEIINKIERLQKGLDKLEAAHFIVKEMDLDIEKMQPDLERASQETELAMERLKIDREHFDFAQRQISRDEAIALQQQAQATELAQKAEQAVAEANVSLDATLQEVQKLKKDHIVEIKSLGSPPKAVRVILGGVVILNQETIKRNGGEIMMRVIDSNVGSKKEEDYFETAKKHLLNDSKELLDMLRNYDKDNIPSYIIARLEQRVLSDPDFSLERARQCSHAVRFLYSWVKAMYDYHHVYNETKPLRTQLEITQKDLQEKTAVLNEKKQQLESINARVKELTDIYNQSLQKKNKLQEQIQESKLKIDRAQKLTEGLKDESKRWVNDISQFRTSTSFLISDSIIAAALLTYYGPFTQSFREEFLESCSSVIQSTEMLINENISLKTAYSSMQEIYYWQVNGLSNVDFSIENSILVHYAMEKKCVPLLIDPQAQGTTFFKNLSKDRSDQIKNNDINLQKMLENSLIQGKILFVNIDSNEINPLLEPLLKREMKISKQGSFIQLGQQKIEYNQNFRLFLFSRTQFKISAQIYANTLVVNFSTTLEALNNQVLSRIVQIENPALEIRKKECITRYSEDCDKLISIENSILNSLSMEGQQISELLKDETLINELQNTKRVYADIINKMDEAKENEKLIDSLRNQYLSTARVIAISYFSLRQLSVFDNMYKWPLSWLFKLIDQVCEKSEKNNSISLIEKVLEIKKIYLEILFDKICPSLKSIHRLLFSLFLCAGIMIDRGELEKEEFDLLFKVNPENVDVPMNPCIWISDLMWPSVFQSLSMVSSVQSLSQLLEDFQTKPIRFRGVFYQEEDDMFTLPGLWNTQCNQFQKLLIVKCFRPDLTTNLIKQFVAAQLGKYFITPYKNKNLIESLNQSTSKSPIIVILNEGCDPVQEILEIAKENSKEIGIVSLGQGQYEKASKILTEASEAGMWVLLQNCHLCQSWLPQLEQFFDENQSIHPDFRLWLTTESSQEFPLSLIENGIKVQFQQLKGIKNILLDIYASSINEQSIDKNKQLLFGLHLFNLDMKTSNTKELNASSEFIEEDLAVSKKFLSWIAYDVKFDFQKIEPQNTDQPYASKVNDSGDILKNLSEYGQKAGFKLF